MFHADCSVTFHDSQQQHDATNAKSPSTVLGRKDVHAAHYKISVCVCVSVRKQCMLIWCHMLPYGTNIQPITAANTWRRTSDKEKKNPLVQGNAAESVKKHQDEN